MAVRGALRQTTHSHSPSLQLSLAEAVVERDKPATLRASLSASSAALELAPWAPLDVAPEPAAEAAEAARRRSASEATMRSRRDAFLRGKEEGGGEGNDAFFLFLSRQGVKYD